MEMFRAPQSQSRFGAQMDLERAAAALGLVALGVLAGRAAIQALLLRSRRPPSAGDQPNGQEPDVVLDVPELEVDRITLKVQHLRANVSILVELAELLNISVGVDARLDEVELEIEGVEAEVHLIARLHNVRAILEKALETIGEHPEILRILARSVSRVVRESLEETLGTLDSALEGLEVGDTVDEALLGRLGEVRSALEDVLERTERGMEGLPPRGALGEGPAGEAPSS
jgi:hypothetical protein